MGVERASLPSSDGLIARTAPDASEESSNRLICLRSVTVLDRRGTWAKVQTEDGSVGLWLVIIGLVGMIIGYGIQGDAGTKSELLAGGLIAGFSGWLIIAGLILLIVGFVRRSRATALPVSAEVETGSPPANSPAATAGRDSGSLPRAVLPSEGLVVRSSPDAAATPLATRLAGSQPVSVLDRRGDWARVRTASGFVGWVDGRRLLKASE